MKLALAALLIATAAMPAEAGPRKYSSRPGYASENKCYKTKYREEYIPGTSNNRGYVRTWREKKEIFVKIRSTGKLIKSRINIQPKLTEVELLEDEFGISPGQACVFYSKDNYGDKLLGGGWIVS